MTIIEAVREPSLPENRDQHRKSDDALEAIDLMADFDGLLKMLQATLERATARPGATADQLDAYLLAAGIDQILEDHLHRPAQALKAVERRAQGGSLRLLRGPIQALSKLVDSLHRWNDRQITSWHVQFRQVVTYLAESVIAARLDDGHRPPEVLPGLRIVLNHLCAQATALPRSLRSTILRLPDCYNSFDMQPEDCERLATKVAPRLSGKNVPLVVVGIRTSGSYLAPLQAVALRRLGYRHVDWIGYRPGQRWHRHERAMLDRALKRSGQVLVVDDPPVTGSKLVATAEHLEALGFNPGSVTLLVPLLGSDEALPSKLLGRQAVSLPHAEWSCERWLQEDAVATRLDRLLRGQRVEARSGDQPLVVAEVCSADRALLEQIGNVTARPLTRSHLRARFSVRVRDERGKSHLLDVYVKGTGVGYFGRHSLAIARRLAGLVPQTYGWEEGLLFRQALPERARATNSMLSSTELASIVSEYVAERANRLKVPVDPTDRLRRREPVWERASDVVLSRFGRAAPFLGPAVRKVVRSLLTVTEPSITDGSTAIQHWFEKGHGDRPGRSFVKVDFDERAFSVWDLNCYDPVWDLAIAAADHALDPSSDPSNQAEFEQALLSDYERRQGYRVQRLRWYLYKTVHLQSVRHHLERLVRDGPGHLQAQDGEPPPHPRIEESGFQVDLRRWIRACDAAIARTADGVLRAAGLDRVCGTWSRRSPLAALSVSVSLDALSAVRALGSSIRTRRTSGSPG